MALMRPLSVICLGLLYMLTGCSKEEVPKTLPRVGVQQVQPTDFAARVTLTGDVQARVQTDLSFRVGGKIISRSVDVGDHVKANQVLARLDPKDLQNNVDSAKAEVFAAQARVTQTSAAFVRQQNCCPRATPARASTMLPRPRCAAIRAHSRPPRRNWPMPTSSSATPHWSPRPPGSSPSARPRLAKWCRRPCRSSAWPSMATAMRCSTSTSRCWWRRPAMPG